MFDQGRLQPGFGSKSERSIRLKALQFAFQPSCPIHASVSKISKSKFKLAARPKNASASLDRYRWSRCLFVAITLPITCFSHHYLTADYFFHLEKTETGRYRFIDVSEASEREMGRQASTQVLQQYRNAILPDSDRRVQQVKRVAWRLIRSAGLDGRQNSQGLEVLRAPYGSAGNHPKSTVNWRVYVINAPEESTCSLLLCLRSFLN